MKNKGLIGLAVGCTILGGLMGGAVSCYMCCRSASLPMNMPMVSVAAVNVSEIVASSAEVQKLQQEQRGKIQQLTEFVKKAQDEIAKESDVNKKTELETKYGNELNAQKTAHEKEYLDKLNEISKNMTKTIEAAAAQKGYTIVLSKEATVSGVADITKDMISKVK